jgi:hypothetical protein
VFGAGEETLRNNRLKISAWRLRFKVYISFTGKIITNGPRGRVVRMACGDENHRVKSGHVGNRGDLFFYDTFSPLSKGMYVFHLVCKSSTIGLVVGWLEWQAVMSWHLPKHYNLKSSYVEGLKSFFVLYPRLVSAGSKTRS